MPKWFSARAYSYDRSTSFDQSTEEIDKQQCNCSPIRFDLEKVNGYAIITRFPHENDFGEVGGTEVMLGRHTIYIDTRYHQFCRMMDKLFGPATMEADYAS
jgi:hypothetical protein